MALKEVRVTSKRKLLELEDITNHTSKVKKVKLCYKSNDDAKKRTNVSNPSTSTPINLDEHVDYIALNSSLRLVEKTTTKIKSDIVQLQKLHNQYSTCNDKQELIDFFLKLLNNEICLPKPINIPNCPSINWSKYFPNSDAVPMSEVNDKLYTKLKLFESDTPRSSVSD